MHAIGSFGDIATVLDVEVSLLVARSASIDWVQGPRRDEAIRSIVDHCQRLVALPLNGRVIRLSQSNFNRNGATVHVYISADNSQQLANKGAIAVTATERLLEATLQSHFGWEQAAVSAQIEVSA